MFSIKRNGKAFGKIIFETQFLRFMVAFDLLESFNDYGKQKGMKRKNMLRKSNRRNLALGNTFVC